MNSVTMSMVPLFTEHAPLFSGTSPTRSSKMLLLQNLRYSWIFSRSYQYQLVFFFNQTVISVVVGELHPHYITKQPLRKLQVYLYPVSILHECLFALYNECKFWAHHPPTFIRIHIDFLIVDSMNKMFRQSSISQSAI
jgi:hypothetical protein